MSWLLDTNVISELTRPVPHSGVIRWLREHEDEFFLSTLALGAIHKGILALPDSARRLDHWFDHEVCPWFAGRLLPVDEQVALR